MGKRWANPITVQGVESDDGRLFNLFEFRDLPLAFRWDKEDDGGHRGAMAVGVMDKVSFDDKTGFWMGEGEYADTPEADQASALADMGAAFLSADPGGKLEYHVDILDADGNIVDPVEIEKAFDAMWDGSPEEAAKADEWLQTLRERTTFDLYEVGGVTQVDIPCWPQCRIALVAPAAPEPAQARKFMGGDRTDAATQRARVLLRRIASGPARMPAAWFAKEELTGWKKWTIDDDGRMSGHLATWNACHRGFTQSCVRPAYQTDFKDFHTGEVALDDDTRLRIGVITHHEGHLETADDYRRLFEDPMAQLGPVRLYADEFGIQACGGVWPDVDPVEVARALGAYTSGDWQLHGREWRLHAVAVVNDPGYAHYEEEDGELVRMVASVPAPGSLKNLTADRTFFDVPASVATQACATCGPQAAAEADPAQAEAHEHVDGEDCGCGGTCGACGTPKLSAQAVHDLVLLDKTLKALGPRVPVG